ncbi:hypothetical protein [Bittarella massiliensis (ex Durand et al. 2017)]|uniref:hypothetical protein n=1 Tax=Bittarella massiliensis (ex Durand et al. 2017) TaxID=1720313 RepID=UPI001AA195E7|nr:hypothetical protein [Bittarella massiliensis (ex Durand et al. 2017)]MBO1678674.1 hypothetical protein [Bittarella massiliensis (ex Durand et al. 2017)]
MRATRKYAAAFVFTLAALMVALAMGVAYLNTYRMVHGAVSIPQIDATPYIKEGAALLWKVAPSGLRLLIAALFQL